VTDIVDAATRSRMMAGIRSKNTRPELIVRQYLHRLGFRFRLHAPELPGKPDLLMPKYRTAIFVHGCFWHQHAGCKYASMPKSNATFWMEKLTANVDRDAKIVEQLRAQHWKTIVIWECEISETVLSKVALRLKRNFR
jgi:DNA mismatch endonuclease, patch repair protein